MKHPTIKQLDYVIGKLKSVAPKAIKEGAFDIDIRHVYSDDDNYYNNEYHYGEIHCAGGWYAFANLRRKFIKDKYNDGYIHCFDGADLLAKDLGFESIDDLQIWADDNPGIWGNENGFYLFSRPSAYNEKVFAGVVKQFEIVRSNLIKLKEK